MNEEVLKIWIPSLTAWCIQRDKLEAILSSLGVNPWQVVEKCRDHIHVEVPRVARKFLRAWAWLMMESGYYDNWRKGCWIISNGYDSRPWKNPCIVWMDENGIDTTPDCEDWCYSGTTEEFL